MVIPLTLLAAYVALAVWAFTARTPEGRRVMWANLIHVIGAILVPAAYATALAQVADAPARQTYLVMAVLGSGFSLLITLANATLLVWARGALRDANRARAPWIASVALTVVVFAYSVVRPVLDITLGLAAAW